jgi:Restriction endonuclease
MTKTEKAVYNRRYYQDNKEKIIAQTKQYRQEHKPEIAAWFRQYRQSETVREARREEGRKYRQTEAGKAVHRKAKLKYRQSKAGKETEQKYSHEYHQTEAGKKSNRKTKDKRRAQKVGVGCENFDREEIFKRDGYVCQACKRKTRPEWDYNHSLFPTLDHIVPLSLGGAHTRANTQCLCRGCNNKKSNTGVGDQLRMF